jgi:hypothetical protein
LSALRSGRWGHLPEVWWAMSLNYTPLRHKMLAKVCGSIGEIALYCANMKRAIWRPCTFGDQDVEVHYSAAESRAIADLFGADLLHTPKWNGDLNRYRFLYGTDAGRSQLDAWGARHGEPQ